MSLAIIYGASKHPVFVKKIKIRTWALRSELKTLIENHQSAKPSNEGTIDNGQKPNFEYQLRDYFESLRSGVRPPVTNEQSAPSGEEIVELAAANGNSGAGEDDLEAAMSAAMASEAQTPPAEAPVDSQGEETSASPVEGAVLDTSSEAQEKSPVAQDLSNVVEIFPKVAALRRRPENLDQNSFQGSLFINDVTMLDICIFSETSYIPGQTVVVEFLIPMHFMVTVEIIQCRRYNMKSRVISPNRGEFRIYAKLLFLHPGERTYLRQFLKSIEPEIKIIAKPKKEESSGGDDLGDLADLGL